MMIFYLIIDIYLAINYTTASKPYIAIRQNTNIDYYYFRWISVTVDYRTIEMKSVKLTK